MPLDIGSGLLQVPRELQFPEAKVSGLGHDAYASTAMLTSGSGLEIQPPTLTGPCESSHNGHMATVGARELKTRLGRYLRQVQDGETILITERGRPVAELRPLSPAATELDVQLQKLAAQGVVRLPTRRKLPTIRLVTLPGPPLSQTIVEDREDRF